MHRHSLCAGTITPWKWTQRLRPGDAGSWRSCQKRAGHTEPHHTCRIRAFTEHMVLKKILPIMKASRG